MRRAKFLLANLLIVVVLYSNGAVLFNYGLARVTGRPWGLPLSWYQADVFSLFGVYSWYETVNHAIEVYGVTPASAEYPEGEIVPLAVTDYFPFRPGEIYSRAMVARHLYLGGELGQYQAWAPLAAKIRGRYNRAHPERPVERVVIVHVTWPRRLEGPELLKMNERLDVLFAE